MKLDAVAVPCAASPAASGDHAHDVEDPETAADVEDRRGAALRRRQSPCGPRRHLLRHRRRRRHSPPRRRARSPASRSPATTVSLLTRRRRSRWPRTPVPDPYGRHRQGDRLPNRSTGVRRPTAAAPRWRLRAGHRRRPRGSHPRDARPVAPTRYRRLPAMSTTSTGARPRSSASAATGSRSRCIFLGRLVGRARRPEREGYGARGASRRRDGGDDVRANRRAAHTEAVEDPEKGRLRRPFACSEGLTTSRQRPRRRRRLPPSRVERDRPRLTTSERRRAIAYTWRRGRLRPLRPLGRGAHGT